MKPEWVLAFDLNMRLKCWNKTKNNNKMMTVIQPPQCTMRRSSFSLSLYLSMFQSSKVLIIQVYFITFRRNMTFECGSYIIIIFVFVSSFRKICDRAHACLRQLIEMLINLSSKWLDSKIFVQFKFKDFLLIETHQLINWF